MKDLEFKKNYEKWDSNLDRHSQLMNLKWRLFISNNLFKLNIPWWSRNKFNKIYQLLK
jgi:hypothetical protein